MQKIEDYIRDEVFAKPLRNWGVLVIYDPARRYREIAESLKDGAVAFVDASESSIESREAAQAALDEMGRQGGKVKGLVIYIPKAKPVNDYERQRDPFSFYGAIGYEFPRGDGDQFRDICLRAKEDSATEVWRVFNENPTPDFAVINAIGGGKSWPTLAAALGNVESVREILLSFLTADEKQRAKLDANDAWVSEAKDLFGTALKLRLVTKSRKWEGIALELWRYLLFSEFAFYLPGTSLARNSRNSSRTAARRTLNRRTRSCRRLRPSAWRGISRGRVASCGSSERTAPWALRWARLSCRPCFNAWRSSRRRTATGSSRWGSRTSSSPQRRKSYRKAPTADQVGSLRRGTRREMGQEDSVCAFEDAPSGMRADGRRVRRVCGLRD